MKILKAASLILAPLFSLLGFDFTVSKLINTGKLSFSRDTQKKYNEIEEKYKEEIAKWVKKKGINLKSPTRREKDELNEYLVHAESDIIDKFSDYLKANRKKRELRLLYVALNAAKVYNEHMRGKFF